MSGGSSENDLLSDLLTIAEHSALKQRTEFLTAFGAEVMDTIMAVPVQEPGPCLVMQVAMHRTMVGLGFTLVFPETNPPQYMKDGIYVTVTVTL